MDVHVGGSVWLFIGDYAGLMCGSGYVCGVSVSVYVCVYRVGIWVYVCGYRCVYRGLAYGYRCLCRVNVWM